jgi:hypothetical protein
VESGVHVLEPVFVICIWIVNVPFGVTVDGERPSMLTLEVCAQAMATKDDATATRSTV